MNWINQIKTYLSSSFESLNFWLDLATTNSDMFNFIPRKEAWSINQILEHIALTNHYLLILINKTANKALKKAGKEPNLFLQLLANYNFNTQIFRRIAIHNAFDWPNPKHMTPLGQIANLSQKLDSQKVECLQILDKLMNGEGLLHSIMMTVDNLGKLNTYEYIYFLAQHTQRHIQQMLNNIKIYNLAQQNINFIDNINIKNIELAAGCGNNDWVTQ